MSARSTSASSCASCWVRERRGSGKTASLSWFCTFISCLHAERTPIASAEAKSRYPARNPSQDCEAEHVAGRAKNQLLPPRAAMALLGYPREHMVPRETWRQRRTQPNPAWILTLEPERLEPMNSRGSDSGPPYGLGALKRLVTSDTQGRKLLLSSTHAK